MKKSLGCSVKLTQCLNISNKFHDTMITVTGDLFPLTADMTMVMKHGSKNSHIYILFYFKLIDPCRNL